VGVVVVLILTIGVGGYYLGARQQHTKAKSDAVVNLSPDEVEVANNPHRDQVAQSPQDNPELKNDDTQSNTNSPFSPASTPANPFYPQQPSPNVARRLKPNIVASPANPARSLPTGTRIIPDEATTGDGQLEAVNGTSLDACVMVVDKRTKRRVREISGSG
jgi:cytoskeletal protein RodZ